jgi:hypothetical protein
MLSESEVSAFKTERKADPSAPPQDDIQHSLWFEVASSLVASFKETREMFLVIRLF